MKKHDEKIEEQKQANVSDGDTRPDKPNNPANRNKTPEDRRPVTKERGADINSIEDAKDAR